MNCTRCSTTGFLNLHQVPPDVLAIFEETRNHEIVMKWIAANEGHDVSACDCCGDGEGWYGEPGEHKKVDGKWDCDCTPSCI